MSGTSFRENILGLAARAGPRPPKHEAGNLGIYHPHTYLQVVLGKGDNRRLSSLSLSPLRSLLSPSSRSLSFCSLVVLSFPLFPPSLLVSVLSLPSLPSRLFSLLVSLFSLFPLFPLVSLLSSLSSFSSLLSPSLSRSRSRSRFPLFPLFSLSLPFLSLLSLLSLLSGAGEGEVGGLGESRGTGCGMVVRAVRVWGAWGGRRGARVTLFSPFQLRPR